MSKPWFLYMLKCAGGSLYTGIAVDVQARFAQHVNGKGAKYTRSHKPLAVVYVEELADRSEASKREYAVKKMTCAAKRALCGMRAPAKRTRSPRRRPDAT